MKARYTVEVEMEDGFPPMTEKTIEGAIWDGYPFFLGAIRSVSVSGGKSNEDVTGVDLFAYAEWKAGKWVLLDYFNTHEKAVNAAYGAMLNTLTAFRKDGRLAVFHYNPNTSVWEKC